MGRCQAKAITFLMFLVIEIITLCKWAKYLKKKTNLIAFLVKSKRRHRSPAIKHMALQTETQTRTTQATADP